MSKTLERNLIVGLDIGTAKVVAVVGEILPDNTVSVVGVGSHASEGMDKGGVNNIELVIKSIKRAVHEAEMMSDCQISSVYLAISGRHIKCQNENGMVTIHEKEVTNDDVDNVIHTAKSVPLPSERMVLHVLPQEFSVDVQEGIKSPVGMSGVRLEAQVHLITCANDMAKNIVKCVERCGLKVEALVASSLASSYAVLTDDEKELGVGVVDVGAGTMDLVVYANSAIRHTSVIAVAGNQVTKDIAQIFRTPLSHAEQIKIQYACAQRHMVSLEESIEVPSVGGRPARSMSRHTLAEVVEPRYQELYDLVMEDISKSGWEEQMAAGIVLTGGTGKMEGAVELAEEVFQMPVRLGYPVKLKGLTEYVDDPVYATAIGLLHYGKEDLQEKYASNEESQGVSNWWQRIQSWFKGEF
ncbi:cell division protein FtsA [Catenovulum agarivorans DS-2]|uniref:Cell division protein FtsA n=1 Tax=Catenovulum agarivorans DS-2 TaxID=1328313 RepID=W7QE81_9ALTE|nr:cell division protein FtsA [Catenovulum agarivorans]EWH11204.1 cell division protein FtsA [Catenovulum agarivorans DS-2]